MFQLVVVLCAGHWVTVQVLLISISFCFVSYAPPSPAEHARTRYIARLSFNSVFVDCEILEVSIKWAGTCHLTKHSHIALLNYHEPQLQCVVDRIP